MIVALDGVEYDVDYKVTSYGSLPSFDDSGEPPEIVIETVCVNDKPIDVSDDLYQKLEDHILEHGDFEPPTFEDDYI